MCAMDLRAVESRLPVDRALDAYMASHHGVITYVTALGLGATPDLVRRRLEEGAWTPVHRGVYVHVATPDMPERCLLAAVRAAGEHAAGSHRSAAWLSRLWTTAP